MGTCLSTDNFNCCIPILEPNAVEKTQTLCLSIPLILRKVLQHLSNNELLQLSLVSKQWLTEARSLMANRGSLIANLSPYTPRTVTTFTWARHDLAALASDLRRMNAAPTSLSGISVNIGFVEWFPGLNTSHRALNLSDYVTLDRIKWRNLSVTLGPVWPYTGNSQEFQLVTKILKDKCEDLVEVTLKAETQLGEKFIQAFLQDISFPRLRTLKINLKLGGRELEFVGALISRAPKLEKLYVPTAILTENILEGSSDVIGTTGEFNPFHELSPCLLNAIRIESLFLPGTCSRDFKGKDMRRFNEIMPVVLRNSQNTLTCVHMELFFALHVMNYGIFFVNMRDLTLFIPNEFYHTSQPAVFDYVKSFDVTSVFPNLSRVNITSNLHYNISPDEITEFTKQGSTVLGERKAAKAGNIKHLRLYVAIAAYDKIKFLAQMFPNIQSLEVVLFPKAPYGLIWEQWPHLKKLIVEVRLKCLENLDSIFCGIHPEEVAQLREKNQKYLMAVNIVPVMPAITCMKELRTLDLKLQYVKPTERLLVLSKVTHLIAFKRCPHLSITVR